MENWKDATSGNSRPVFRTSSTNAFPTSFFRHPLFPRGHLQETEKKSEDLAFPSPFSDVTLQNVH